MPTSFRPHVPPPTDENARVAAAPVLRPFAASPIYLRGGHVYQVAVRIEDTERSCLMRPPELRRSTPSERKVRTLVQAAHFIAVEPLLLDFEVGPLEQL